MDFEPGNEFEPGAEFEQELRQALERRPARTDASILRSAAMPSANVCSPCSGWLRRFF